MVISARVVVVSLEHHGHSDMPSVKPVQEERALAHSSWFCAYHPGQRKGRTGLMHGG